MNRIGYSIDYNEIFESYENNFYYHLLYNTTKTRIKFDISSINMDCITREFEWMISILFNTFVNVEPNKEKFVAKQIFFHLWNREIKII